METLPTASRLGLTRVDNPPNPYLTDQRELIGPPPEQPQEIYVDHSKNILSKNDSPDIGFTWSLNPYRGCFHSCAYCLSGDTPVLMGNGRTKPIADVRTGDEIYGTTLGGTYRHLVKTHVIAHWSSVKPAYRITLEDGTQLTASGDHRFLSNRGWKYVTGTEWGNARRPHLTIRNHLLGTGRFSAPPEKDAEYQRGYLCGMIRGDGSIGSYAYSGRRRGTDVQHRFRLALIDLEALSRSARYLLEINVPTQEFLFQKAAVGYRPVYAIRTSVRLHVERVKELIRWPTALSSSWRKGFLAGIFDAEGCYSRGILRISNADCKMIEWIVDSLRRLKFDSIVEETKVNRPGKPILVVRVRGGLREHLRFFHMVDPAISRKKDISWQAIKNQAKLRVVSIEPLGFDLPMFDITTGTGDFIANGVVSHNCFARPTHEYYGLGAGSDFERKLFVKPKAPRLLEAAFQKRSWQGETIVFSGVTDCYQPIEAAWKLTRGCLEVCLKYRNPVAIITKSALIRRDARLLAELARQAAVSVSISIPFLDPAVARAVEPGAPSPAKRFETMKLLADAGVPVGIGVAPVIPGLNPSDIPGLLRRAKENGARFAFHTLLRLPGSVRPVFLSRIRERLPLAARKIEDRIRESRDGRWYDPRFGHRHEGHGEYWAAVERSWGVWTERLGFNRGESGRLMAGREAASSFRRPHDRNGQRRFDW